MLDHNQIAAASRILNDHWRAGTKLGALEASQRPHDRADGYAIQAAIERTSTKPLFGWKIYQRGRPAAYQCRRSDGRAHSGRNRHPEWRHRFDDGK